MTRKYVYNVQNEDINHLPYHFINTKKLISIPHHSEMNLWYFFDFIVVY